MAICGVDGSVWQNAFRDRRGGVAVWEVGIGPAVEAKGPGG